MKKNIIRDERVSMQKQKITTEAFSLIMMFLIGAILVKQFIFQAEFHEYAVEFVAFFGGCLYIVARNICAGNNLFGEDKKSLPIVNSLVIGVTITAVTAFLHYEEFNNINNFIVELIVAFLSSTLAAFLFYYILNKVTRKRIKAIEKKFDEDDV